MPHVLPIGERSVEITWNRETALRYGFRASDIGGAPSIAKLRNPKTAAAAVTKLLWCCLPPSEIVTLATPEDLYTALDHEKHAAQIHAVVVGIVGDMFPSDEKKSTSKNLPSQESNSELPATNGNDSTPEPVTH